MQHADELKWGEECGGAPKWMVTFADLMSLILCFFVLLISFSELDTDRYRGAAGSVREALGRPASVAIPPEANALDHFALQAEKPALVEPDPTSPTAEPNVIAPAQEAKVVPNVPDDLREHLKYLSPVSRRTQQAVETLVTAIHDAIGKGWVDVLVNDDGVLVRINEQGSFPSGTAELQSSFLPVIAEMTKAFNQIEGRIVVDGHTDDRPIQSLQYPSNWVLSAARAASVVHHLTAAGLRDPGRVEIRAHADTAPAVPNDSPENRNRNRRVEINVSLREPPAAPPTPSHVTESKP